ncbi:MAG: NUDIX hydrolase [Anaerolineaceae bacterium]|nr:NUDIX hydrolase [Anaerolineaceae bacterium]
MNTSNLIEWAQRLTAIAQCGLTYNSDNLFEKERYEQINAIAAEIMAAQADEPLETFLRLFDDQSKQGYATPKVDVRGVVFNGDQILLVKEHATGAWTFPGGWVDVGDRPSSAVEREVWEESGFRVRASKLCMLADRNLDYPPGKFHIYKLFFLCDLLGGKPTVSNETDAVGFFSEDDLPPLDTSRTSKNHLAKMFAFHRDPALPTLFD